LDKNDIVKFLGLAFVVIFVLSMLAAGLLYNNTDTSNNNSNVLPSPKENAYNYTLTFDTTATKELTSFRFAGTTSSTDKAMIDSEVLRTAGVSKVTSVFKKLSTDANNWIYLAEVSIKKDYTVTGVYDGLSQISYFDKSSPPEAMKYMVISVPAWVMIHNTDLNTDKNFSFPSVTLSSLTSLGTQAGDSINVSGNMRAQGQAILSLELIETTNYTQQDNIQKILDQIKSQDQNAPLDANSPSDTNTPIIIDGNI
jgi:hypothetical protein